MKKDRSELAEQRVPARSYRLFVSVWYWYIAPHFAIDFDICDVTPSINVIDVKVVNLRFVDSFKFKSCFF